MSCCADLISPIRHLKVTLVTDSEGGVLIHAHKLGIKRSLLVAISLKWAGGVGERAVTSEKDWTVAFHVGGGV